MAGFNKLSTQRCGEKLVQGCLGSLWTNPVDMSIGNYMFKLGDWRIFQVEYEPLKYR